MKTSSDRLCGLSKLLLFLDAVALCIAFILWAQLVGWRLQKTDLADECGALDTRLHLFQRRNATLKNLAAQRKPQRDVDQSAAQDSSGADASLANLLSSRLLSYPEYAAAAKITRLQRVYEVFVPLLRTSALSAEQRLRLEDLLCERLLAPAMVNATAQAINMRLGTADNDWAVRAEVDSCDKAIMQLIGPDEFAVYQDCLKADNARSTVAALYTRLSYTENPLTDAQREALVRVGTDALSFGALSRGNRLQTILALPQAAQVLSPTQLAVAAQMQAEEQAATQLGQSRRKNPGRN